MHVAQHSGSFSVGSGPDRSIGGMRRQGPVDRFDEAVGEDERIQPESFTQDPGMRARDEFTDITSKGYNEWATRVAENPQKRYATSVEEEEGQRQAETLRTRVAYALALLAGQSIGRMAIGPRASPRRVFGAGLAPGTNLATMVGALTPEIRVRGWTPHQIGRRMAEPAWARINDFLEEAYANSGISLWGENGGR